MIRIIPADELTILFEADRKDYLIKRLSITNVQDDTITINLYKKLLDSHTLINIEPLNLELESGSTMRDDVFISRGEGLAVLSTGTCHVDLTIIENADNR